LNVTIHPEAEEAFNRLHLLNQANLLRQLHALADGATGSLGDVDRPTMKWTIAAGCFVKFTVVGEELLVLALKRPPDEPEFG
jgi:hypothetical protein